MPNRDEYLFDIIRDAGLDLSDPGDWNNISNFVSELVEEGYIEG